MSYNLQSLITILEQILDPQQTLWILDHNKPQLESLLQKADYLQKILDNSSVPKIESLESQIRDTSHKAEDIIELQMADQDHRLTLPTPDLQQVIEELDSATEQVAELMKGKNMSTGSSSTGASPSPVPRLKSSVVVGVDADLMRLKDRLIGTKSKLEIIPIVGMGGVGKTTLARKLYEDPLVLSHFKSLAWTTISQDYNIKAILLDLLRCITGNEYEHGAKVTDHELRDILYKSLYGRRYMIVLDDIWSSEFWDVIRKYFPDNNNGSRIVITSRELNVVKYVDSQSPHHEVQLLSASQSWDLLSRIVFGEEDCPIVLQEIGAKMAGDCGGLPLAINVIGGLLSKVERSQEVWENIGKDVRAAIAESDKQFSQILYLSYNHLPNHLKPCFLYMGAFPEDFEIKASRLKCLWIAEGFVKSIGDNFSLEEEAEGYLKALVERNLLLDRDYGYNGKARKCSMHDLLRDVCTRKADEEKFLHIWSDPKIPCSNLRRVSVPPSFRLVVESSEPSSIALSRTFLYPKYDVYGVWTNTQAFYALRLLRVLDVFDIVFFKFPKEVLQLVNLRYLALNCYSIPPGISKLRNLQTLIACLESGYLKSSELMEMSELRYIMLNIVITMPGDYMKRFTLKKLERINMLELDDLVIGRGLFENFPNIKNLGICFSNEFHSGISVDLSQFHKLEILRIDSWLRRTDCHLPTVTYPCGLRKLTLKNCAITPRVLTTLCALSKLEALKIERCLFGSEDENDDLKLALWRADENDDEEWNAAEEDVFLSLQYLKLVDLKLARWRADETNFPRLRHLFIVGCDLLEEIPCGIGEISALQLIELRRCSDSVVASAKQIQEVQQSDLGDYSLQLRVYE